MSEGWKCPDCAEDVPQGATMCPYCGYDGSSAKTLASGMGEGATAASENSPATRTVRYGHCPSCGQSEWEGAMLGRCATCGAELQSLQVVEVPNTASSEARPEVTTPAEVAAVKPAETRVRQTASAQTSAATEAVAAPESDGIDPPAAMADGVALLRELAALRDEGIITNDDFETKKAEILRRL
jgi:hypothetical protein